MEREDFSQGVFWAINPDVFCGLHDHFLKFNSPKLADVAASLSEEISADEYQIVDRVAFIPITGIIIKKESPFSVMFGGVGISEISGLFKAAVENPNVDAIVLDIDSHGGTLFGVNELSNSIYKARAKKPIVAYSSGNMAASAYWIGSAADKIILGQTTNAGSIGILLVHNDYSEAEKMAGIKTTYITAGKYKALGNSSEPLSDLGRETYQAQLDYMYKIFIDAVARNRGVTSATVDKNMGDGRNFIGQQAVDAGLADRTGRIEDALDLALDLVKNKKPVSVPSSMIGAVKSFFAAAAQAPKAEAKLSFEDQAKQEYATEKEIRAEFRSEGAYVAYQKALFDGKVKICTGQGVKQYPKPEA